MKWNRKREKETLAALDDDDDDDECRRRPHSIQEEKTFLCSLHCTALHCQSVCVQFKDKNDCLLLPIDHQLLLI